ncbi:golgin subfamily A member 6-like protein 22 isoform X3 [Brassica rapa]|uniref:golgin subfamily A member 6-like protein 22 isoform X3 n=1 Tax=Brassica campestris TaxID=3711 RepID=UPI00142E893B|nr:golgin subfamily A member 6-like protein 22 isoform X3 [Brassica rapa]
MEQAKTEVEKKVSRLLKFLQNKNKIPRDSKRELLAIATDLQEHCQSLYSSIDDFQQDLDPTRSGGRSKVQSRVASSEDIVNLVEQGSKLEALRNEAEEKEHALALRVKELERELEEAKAECDRRKGDLEEEIEMKASESKQLGEMNKGLRSQISGLKLVLKETGDEISTLVNKFGKSELGLTSRIEDLKCQLRNLEQEIGFLRERNAEQAASFQVKRVEDKERVNGLMDQVSSLKHELQSLRNKKVEQVTEREMQVKSVEQETDEERNKLHEEIDHLREENKKLHTIITELESSQMEREIKNTDENEDKSKKLDAELSHQKNLAKEQDDVINSRLLEKIKDQERLVKEQKETIDKFSEDLKQQDDVIRRLSATIKDQERLVKEQKETIDKFSEDLKQSKRWSLGSSRDSKLNPNAIEKKMEEIADDFRMKIEDHIRILYRRIHVAEQIHLESKNEYIKIRDIVQENKETRESLLFYQTHFKRIKDTWEKGYTRSTKKLEEAEEHTDRVARLAKEIDSAKIWVCEKKSELETLAAKLECGEAQETLLKEKLSKLEKKLAEEGTEKLSLAKVVTKFEARIKELEINVKGREIELLSLGEEKREAIRQLCVLVDYQRDRYDDLKKSVLKVSLKT